MNFQHLKDVHGVMLTRRETFEFSVEILKLLWRVHGPHDECEIVEPDLSNIKGAEHSH